MANPKNRTSRKRRDQRRAMNWGLALPTLVVCPQCREVKMPHRACPSCGFYAGREVLKLKKEEK